MLIAKRSIFIPSDLRVIVYSFFSTRELLRKVSHLSKTERRLVKRRTAITKGRSIRLNSLNPQRQAYLYELVDMVSLKWPSLAKGSIEPSLLVEKLALLPERLRDFNISAELLLESTHPGNIELQRQLLEAFFQQLLNSHVKFRELTVHSGQLSMPLYINKLLNRVQKLCLVATKLSFSPSLQRVFSQGHSRIQNDSVQSLTLRSQAQIALESVSFRQLRQLTVLNSNVSGLDDSSLRNLRDINLSDMTLLRRACLQSKSIEAIQISSLIDPQTAHYESKSHHLKKLSFATGKACLIEILNGNLFSHCQETSIFTSRACNCYKSIEMSFPVPEARVALLNSEEQGTKCELLSSVYVRPLLDRWKVNNNAKVQLDAQTFYQLELREKESSRLLRLNVKHNDLEEFIQQMVGGRVHTRRVTTTRLADGMHTTVECLI